MTARLALIPDKEDPKWGVVKPVIVKNGDVLYGLSVGHYTTATPNGNIHIVLNEDIDTIIHEVATSKAVNAELRQSAKEAKGKVWIKRIELDPVTKRFRQYEVRPE